MYIVWPFLSLIGNQIYTAWTWWVDVQWLFSFVPNRVQSNHVLRTLQISQLDNWFASQTIDHEAWGARIHVIHTENHKRIIHNHDRPIYFHNSSPHRIRELRFWLCGSGSHNCPAWCNVGNGACRGWVQWMHCESTDQWQTDVMIWTHVMAPSGP